MKRDECYHLAAQSFVSYSFDDEFSTLNSNINGTHYLLSALRYLSPECCFYFAGSSEMFGKAEETPQNERTRFHPRSSYRISKVAGYELTRNYREAYGMFASAGILFNDESPRRGYEFVTRKITSGVALILAGKRDKISIGNLEASGTGGMPANTFRQCGRCCSAPFPTIMSSPRARRIPSRNSSSSHSAWRVAHWHRHVELTPLYTGLRRFPCSWGRAKRLAIWDGKWASVSRNWLRKWWLPIAKRRTSGWPGDPNRRREPLPCDAFRKGEKRRSFSDRQSVSECIS